jgi:signal transduction histidine kinase
LNTTENEIERCSRIVSNLLAFSRKSPQTFSPLSIVEVIQRCIALSRHRMELSNIEWVLNLPDHLPQVAGDANQLQQCIINLIFNAIDAMSAGGRLTLSVLLSGKGNHLTLMLEDNGCGIHGNDLPHIFEPFFTTKQEGCGTGLGLSTTYAIVESHRGSIQVDSRLGKGTTFTIDLPVAD